MKTRSHSSKKAAEAEKMKKSQAKQEKKGEVQSLEERREFIRQWRVEITEEIAEMECRARATICHHQ